jgi:hypothetical protein
MVSLDNVMDAIQRWHHDVRANHIPLGYDYEVHSFGLKCSPIFHSPLADPALWTAYRHDSAKRNQQDFAKNNPNIFLLGHNKNWA